MLNALGSLLKSKTALTLTITAIVGVTTSTVLAVKATPKALKLIEKKKEELNVEKLPPLETVKTVWKEYLPSACTILLTSGCIVGAHIVDSRKIATLTTALNLSTTAFNEYKKDVSKIVTPEQKDQIETAQAERSYKKIVERLKSDDIWDTGNGKDLCLEALTNTPFYSDVTKIKHAENILASRMINDMSVTLNDYFDELDLPHTALGEDLGWHIKDGIIEFDYSSILNLDDRPMLVVTPEILPKSDFLMYT